MKKYMRLYIAAGIIILAGFLLYTSGLKIPPRPDVDTAAVNEIVKITAYYWCDPEQLSGIDTVYRFFVIDNNGNVRFSSGGITPDSFQTAIRNGYLPMSIIVENKTVGQVLIETNKDDYIKQAQTRLSVAVICAAFLLCLLMITTLTALHSGIIRPFERLEAFAHKMTTGMFDEPLPVDRRNMFGLFTQSFDVMRVSLLEARQQQLAAERAKKELIASLNHDIKTPVTSIKLTTELLQAGGVDPAIGEKLKIIDMKADQINRLMNDMLHSALEELGELKVSLASHSSGILSDIFKSTDYLSKSRINDIPPCLIELDIPRMEQVIGNIVTNSYKYAGTDINVSFKIQEDFLQVDIDDFGTGVDQGELDLICAKFYRGENAKAAYKEGEGLGLYVAGQLMELMGGGLEAFNREDGFTIRLWIRLSR